MRDLASTLQWDGKQLVGSYLDVKLERGVAYQWRVGLTGDIFTGTWTGYMDVDACPTFKQIETGAIRCPRNATNFARLSDVQPEGATP